MSNYVNYNERTVSFKGFLSYLIKKWKMILIISICVSVLFGGFKTVKSYKEFKAYTGTTTTQENNPPANISIDNYNKLMAETEKYLKESEKMNIDPYNVHSGTLLYYVNNDFKVNVNSLLQEPNKFNTILMAYRTYIQSGMVYDYILENSDLDLTRQDLSELISYSTVMESNDAQGFSVKVIAKDADRCAQLLDLIEKGISEYSVVASDTIEKHNLVTVSKNQSVYFDDGIRWYQTDKYNYLQQLKGNAGAIYGTLQNATIEQAPQVTFSKMDIIKNLILGFVVGLILSFAFILIKFLMTKKFISEDILTENLDVDLIGSVLSNEKISGLEKLAVKLENRQLLSMDRKQQLDLVSTNAKILSENNDCKKIMVIGTLKKENDAKLVTEIIESFKNANIDVSDYKNVLTDANALADVQTSDGVIIIEKQDNSYWYDIRKEIETVKKLNNKFVGFITIE